MSSSIGRFDQPHKVGRQTDSTKQHDKTGPHSQTTLEESPSYEKNAHFSMRPSWSEKAASGFKTAGLVVSAVICGALALGLLPLTITGGVFIAMGMLGQAQGSDDMDVVEGTVSPERQRMLDQKRESGKNWQLAGTILAAPAVGLFYCINGIAAINNYTNRFAEAEESITTAVTDKDMQGVFNAQHVIRRNLTDKEDLLTVKRYISSLTIEEVPNLKPTQKELLLTYVNERLKNI